MTSFLRPGLKPRLIRNLRLPVALVEGVALIPDAEGLAPAEIEIAGGRIAAIRPVPKMPPARAEDAEHGMAPPRNDVPVIDMRGGQVWPLFVDVHTHLDKGHIWNRAPNPDGTHATAARTVAADRKAHWQREDVARRFDFGLRCAHAHGTGAIRTHLDSYEPEQAAISFAVFRDMAAEWRGRMVLQPVVMARLDHYAEARERGLLRLAAETGGALGGILKMDAPTPEGLNTGLDRLMALADAEGLDIDLHIDETEDPASGQLERLAEAVMRNRFRGRVTAGHCCSLSMQSDEDAARVIAKVAEAGISIVTLPMVNLYLQGRRPARTPQWRGLTRVHELAAAGVAVAAASDNCRDPFFAYGDHDVMEVFREFTRIAHLDLSYDDWVGSVTRNAARIMGSSQGRIAPGMSADLILFRGRGMSELLARPQSDRAVLRQGCVADTTLPDHAELDLLSEPLPA
ncbi:cytosine deaminase [Haematobacter massiliensis]|uniref:Cytosine deaminase n=1 Tax=Haematobacter massiliensis TaxID=195105 RepID=A0A086Y4U9_9RHOB|nr:cytosine deaminase [Haematobacter massiliensis]KFI29299.1 cytosine deaminase [Haematobacter massiliensis]OWJ69892.1 cytosine deaminase [Haematobacter massiliensis]OWJ82686.1 cytosine deaminase [Haematobacter massiliensis]QBJ25916.1 cytosine deaminase [Haematobacter massiliensis]